MIDFAKVLVLTLGMLLVPLTARATEDGIATIPPGDDVIKTLKKGALAPFSGQLFSTDTAMRWGFWLQQYKLRLREDVLAEISRCEVELEYDAKVLAAEKVLRVTLVTDMTARLTRSETARIQAEDDARNPGFFRTVEFGLILGVGGAVVVAVAVAYAAGSIR